MCRMPRRCRGWIHAFRSGLPWRARVLLLRRISLSALWFGGRRVIQAMPSMNDTPPPSGDRPVKGGRARIARNIAYNWVGMCCEAVVGFLLLPLLVGRLGD